MISITCLNLLTTTSVLSAISDICLSLATALIQSRLDYSNSVLYGTSTSNLHKLQMAQNALARTSTRSPRSVPTSQLLSNLHWLPIHKRINFKVATLQGPHHSTTCMLTFIISYPTINPVVLSVPLVSLSCTFPGQKPILDVVLSPLLLPKSGTIYLRPLESHHHLTPLYVTSKHTSLPLHNFLTTYSDSPHLWFNFFNFGALPNILHYITLQNNTSKPLL